MLKVKLWLVVAVVLVPSLSLASGDGDTSSSILANGRYTFVTPPSPGSESYVLDTQTGKLWALVFEGKSRKLNPVSYILSNKELSFLPPTEGQKKPNKGE